MRAASATVRPKGDVLPRSDAQRSHRLSLGSVWADFVTDNIPHKSSWGVEGSLWEIGSRTARSRYRVRCSRLNALGARHLAAMRPAWKEWRGGNP